MANPPTWQMPFPPEPKPAVHMTDMLARKVYAAYNTARPAWNFRNAENNSARRYVLARWGTPTERAMWKIAWTRADRIEYEGLVELYWRHKWAAEILKWPILKRPARPIPFVDPHQLV